MEKAVKALSTALKIKPRKKKSGKKGKKKK